MNSIKLITALFFLSIFFTSCNKEKEVFSTNFSGLEDLGPDYKYEGWLIVNGEAKTAGIFSVDANGTLSQTEFEVAQKDLNKADRYVLTIEPFPDSDPSASSVHILAGDFNGNTASLTSAHSSALGNDFSSAAGSFILATPTDGNSNQDETSGVWFLDPNGPSASLNLPSLPSAWEYEGWAVINGTPVSTGKFSSSTAQDDANSFSGVSAGPNFPGEDFLNNPPSGLTFPTDLSESTIVISIEPIPDNDAAPFALKPLVGNVPMNASSGVSYALINNASATNPTGSITR